MAEGAAGPGVDRSAGIADLELEIEHLHKALISRDVIGQAKGILMERFKLTADEAFLVLVKASQHQNVRVAELSVTLADTGEWTEPAPEL
ncbi:MAG: ANTAR domain-containing protein [Acidimicrobiia bacterium]|nr:ANTAR domain-containing protein [Acidimicrobiia bacterium]